MGWLDEAEAILTTKNANNAFGKNPQNPDIINLVTEKDKESFKKEVRTLYESATDREIDLAIERIENHFTPPYSKKELISYVRQFVEGD